MFVQYYHPLLYEPYAAFLGLTPGEDSSGGDQHRLGITKAGNRHVRMLLVEVAQSFAHGKISYKSQVYWRLVRKEILLLSLNTQTKLTRGSGENTIE